MRIKVWGAAEAVQGLCHKKPKDHQIITEYEEDLLELKNGLKWL